MNLSSILHVVEDAGSKALHAIFPSSTPNSDVIGKAVSAVAQQLVSASTWQSITDKVIALEQAGLSSLEKKSSLVQHIEDLLPVGFAASAINWLAESAVSVVKNTFGSLLGKVSGATSATAATTPTPAPAAAPSA